jgi:hypothetical protein
MRLKSTILTLLAICLLFNSQSKPVDISKAGRVAKNFLYVTAQKYTDGISYENLTLTDPYTHLLDGTPVFYAFQANPGFVIIAADDAFTPVIGYSFDGSFSLTDAPEHYKSFIMGYAQQIAYIRENQAEPGPELSAYWTELSQDGIPEFSGTRERDVAPLLSCKWDQGAPYNIYCPEDEAGPGGHVYVGCVATAMAQIMYYWRYPETGTGQHCYTPQNSSYGQQCANFGATNYDWEGMKNGVDNRNPYANAELQYHCAVSVNMMFGPNGSGSYSYLVPSALEQYFRYNDAVYEEKGDYSHANWINLLKNDIDAGKPLYYSGYTSDWSGHAFVCDGYQGDNFHFNFGWSGNSNGYYTLYDVGGFNIGQACVRNFSPSDNNYPYQHTGTKSLNSRSGSITDGSGPIDNYTENITAYWLIDPQTIYDSISSITLSFSAFDLADGDFVKVYDGPTTSHPVLGEFSGTATPPAVSSTQNTMLLEFVTNSSGNAGGWYAEYSTSSPTWCQGLTQLSEPSGTFNDGSGDFYYQSSATCMWRIVPPNGEKITLNFNYLDTEPGHDRITVFDGTTVVAEISGNQIPGPVTASSGIMFITWTTNNSENFQGWEAFYEIEGVGIEEGSMVRDLEVYPNPATDYIHIRFGTEEKGKLMVRLSNVTGQAVFTENINSFSGDYLREIPVGQLPAGFYSLEIRTLSGITNKKILIH